MKIENFSTENQGNLAKVAATIIWEDCDRPAQEVFVKTTEKFASDISCNPHTFLVAGIIPAMYFQETRIAIDAEICPELKDGLLTAMSWIRHWYGGNRQLVQIEAKTQSSIPTLTTPKRTASFLTGGIDSLATLRANRLHFPKEHPGSIKDCLFVYGLDNDESKDLNCIDSFLTNIALDAEVTMIPVSTNFRTLNDDWVFWEHEFEAAVFAAIAHAFQQRFERVILASTYDIPNMQPLGSHPVIDPNYSGHQLQIKHDGITLSRLERTKLIADWDVALQNLQVCNKRQSHWGDKLNCGRCEKCLRTMLALLVLGMLDKTNAFAEDDVSKQLLLSGAYLGETTLAFYDEVITHLAELDREDLISGIERIKIRYYEKDLQGMIKKFDRKFLKGNLVNSVKKFKQLKLKARGRQVDKSEETDHLTASKTQ